MSKSTIKTPGNNPIRLMFFIAVVTVIGVLVYLITHASSTTLTTMFSVPTNTTGWLYELSGAQESIVTNSTSVTCTAGGYTAPSHYARVRRKLPEQDDFVGTGSFRMSVDFILPADFYTKQQSYLRILNTDNFPGVLKSTGQTVGALTADEWRVGFLLYGSDHLPRLMSAHENHEEMELWKGTQLSTGRHTVSIDFTPSTTSTGSWRLMLDGSEVGSGTNVRTVPTTVQSTEMVVTRVVGCIDGAAQQSTQQVSLTLNSIAFTSPIVTATPTPIPGVTGDLNNDTRVNVFDLSILLSKWGTSDTLSDLNKDGTVNVFDLSTLLGKWTG